MDSGNAVIRLHPVAAEAMIVAGDTVTRWALTPAPRVVARGRLEAPTELVEVAPGPEGPLLVGTRPGGWSDAPRQLELRGWDDGRLVEVVTVPGSGVGVTGLACSADGSYLAMADFYEAVRLIDLSTRQVVSTAEAGEATSGLAFSPDGRWLTGICTFQGGGDISVWSIRQGRLVQAHAELDRDGLGSPWDDLADTFGATAFSPDAGLVMVATSTHWARPKWVQGLTCYALPGGQRRWHRTIGPDLVAAPPPGRDGPWGWSDLVVTPDGRWVVCGTHDGQLLAFAMTTGELVGRARVHAGPVTSLQVGPDPEPAVWTPVGHRPVAVPLSRLHA